ncbi:Mobile element protein [Streptococcus pneumoniae]|nr:Mobile element protein [Streptococcus pneumoniae]
MGRKPKKRPEERTELERLQAENEYLRAENAILKKLRELRLKEDIQRNNSPLTCDNRLSLHSVKFLFTRIIR